MARCYLDFDLLIERIDDRYRAHVLGSPAGETTSWLPTPWPDTELEQVLQGLTPSARLSSPLPQTERARLVKQIGDGLFCWLFSGNVERSWHQSLALARERDCGLRLRLRLSQVAELAHLPWEYLHDPTGNCFVAASPETPLVRYLELEKPIRRLRAHPRLHVLVLASNASGSTPLAATDERGRIAAALEALEKDGRIVVDHLEATTLDGLAAHLASTSYQVLHLIGHGVFDPQLGGALVLADAHGEAYKVSAERMGALLRSHMALRLVVLNACEGARAAPGDAFTGVAQSLVQQGIPAVVAMQFPISNHAAIAFASHFYTALAAGTPIDGAVAQARQTMYVAGHEVEWGTPVLYLHAPDGTIFDAAETAQPAAPSRLMRPPAFTRRQLWLTATVLAGAALLAIVLSWRTGLEGWVRREWPVSAALLNSAGCASPPGLGLAFARIEPPDSAPPFCLGIFEVTRGQWREVMGDEEDSTGDDGLPQASISWDDAQTFIAKLNERDPGHGYRLPSNAEWELAARAGTTSDYSFGSDPAELWRYGNCSKSVPSDGFDGAAPVGSYRPNPWGLYDVHGNVWEWVDGPFDASLPPSPTPDRLRRGGAFSSVPPNCESVSRSGSKLGGKSSDIGFRVARDVG